MVHPVRPVMPLPFRVGLAILSVVLTLAGLTSIASSVVVLNGFIADFAGLYTDLIRGPVAAAVAAVWPVAWPHPAPWIYDVAVVWTFSFTAIRAFLLFEADKSVIHRRHIRSWKSIALVAALGPFAPFYLIIGWGYFLVAAQLSLIRERVEDFRGTAPLSDVGRIALQKREEAAYVISQNLVQDAKKLVLYYTGIIGLVVLFLLINYQIGLLAPVT